MGFEFHECVCILPSSLYCCQSIRDYSCNQMCDLAKQTLSRRGGSPCSMIAGVFGHLTPSGKRVNRCKTQPLKIELIGAVN